MSERPRFRRSIIEITKEKESERYPERKKRNEEPEKKNDPEKETMCYGSPAPILKILSEIYSITFMS